MDFKDRVPQYPGRIKLTPVSGQTNVYDMIVMDSASVAGTPLNKATFDQFKAELTEMIANGGAQGTKGDKGEKGDPGVSSTDRVFLVGSNSTSCSGWYKLGSVTLNSNYLDYHAKISITGTYNSVAMPNGLLSVDIRYGNGAWEGINVTWEQFTGSNPDYIAYTTNTSGTITFYVYIPQQYVYCRVHIVNESNRDVYTKLFQPSASYGGIYTTRYTTSALSDFRYPIMSRWKCYSWVYTSECSSDKVVSCSKSTHGLNTVYGAILIPRSTATSTSGLSGYANVTSGTCRYGVTVSGTTVYATFDDGVFKHGFYALIYGE